MLLGTKWKNPVIFQNLSFMMINANRISVNSKHFLKEFIKFFDNEEMGGQNEL